MILSLSDLTAALLQKGNDTLDMNNHLLLSCSDLECITEYDTVQDYAQEYLSLLEATQAAMHLSNLTIDISSECCSAVFPILTTLFQHLPNPKRLDLQLVTNYQTPWQKGWIGQEEMVKQKRGFQKLMDCANRFEEITLRLWPCDVDLHSGLLPLTCHLHNVHHVVIRFPRDKNDREALSLEAVATELLRVPHLRSLEIDAPCIVDSLDGIESLSNTAKLLHKESFVRLVLGKLHFFQTSVCQAFHQGLVHTFLEHLELHYRLSLARPNSGYQLLNAGISRAASLKSLVLDSLCDNTAWLEWQNLPIALETLVVRGLILEDCQEIALAIRNNNCLVHLDLTECRNMNMHGACTILSAVAQQSTLLFLGIRIEQASSVDSQSDEAFVAAFASLCKSNRSCLKELQVLGSALEPTPVVAPSVTPRALPPAQGRLVLNQKEQKSLLGRELVQCLQQNYCLEHCLVELADSDTQAQLACLARLNKAGRKEYLQNTSRSKKRAGVCVLVKVRDNLNDLLTFLLEEPCLCHDA